MENLESEQQVEEEEEQQPVKLTFEEIKERVLLKRKILQYKVTFPHLLKEYEFGNLDDLTPEQLENLLTEFQIVVNTSNSGFFTKTLYFESLRIGERISPIVNLRINGLAEALHSQQAVHDTLNELSLKYQDESVTSPEARLAYLTLSTAMSLHKLNTSRDIINSELNKKIDQKTVDEFKDL
jgi:hypothetical protein